MFWLRTKIFFIIFIIHTYLGACSSVDPDQVTTVWVVWSGSTLYVCENLEIYSEILNKNLQFTLF